MRSARGSGHRLLGGDRPPLDLLAEARSGLYGEFDVPNEEAVLHSVKVQLYLGFGAEAGQTAGLLALQRRT